MKRASLGYVTPLLPVTEYTLCHNAGDYKINFYALKDQNILKLSRLCENINLYACNSKRSSDL